MFNLNVNIKTLYTKYLGAATGSAFLASIFATIDAMMIGKYHGAIGTAAVAIFNPCWTIIYSSGLFIGIGGATLFAVNKGGEKEKISHEYFTVSIVLGALISILLFGVLTLNIDRIFYFFGANTELVNLTKLYFASIKFAIPICVFDSILSAYLRNDNNPELAFWAVIVGGIFNAILDYYFVFILDMGIFGAGLATAIGLTICTMTMLLHLLTRKCTLKLVMPSNMYHKIKEVIILGFPTAIMDLAMGIVGILFNRQIMYYFGTNELAIYGVITQITAFAQCSSYGIGQASQPIISYNFGANNIKNVKECLKLAMTTCFIMGLLWLGVTRIEPNLFIKIFMSYDKKILELAPFIISSYGLSYLLLPFNIFSPYYFQSILKPKTSLISSILRSIVVSCLLIVYIPKILNPDLLWLSMLFTEMIVGIYNVSKTIKLTKNLENPLNKNAKQ